MSCVLEPSPLEYQFIVKYIGEEEGQLTIKNISASNSITGDVTYVEDGVGIEVEQSEYSIHPWQIYDGYKAENIVFEKGEYVLEEDLIINKNSSLTINSGVNLKLEEGVSIFVNGELNINGTVEEPVIFEAVTEDKPWGVLALQGYNTDYEHQISNTIFKNGGLESRYENTLYTGMVSAYNTRVTIENSEFISNVGGDDTFNGKNSYVHINNCKFIDTFSDSIDFDYTEGIIENSYFENAGNDSIDIMTSTPTIRNNYIVGSGDKGISVGENSEPVIFNNIIINNEIGIQSKDMSYPMIVNNIIYDNNVGIHLYKKNLRYGGGGQAVVVNSIVTGNKKYDYECRDNSTVTFINSNIITGDGDGVDFINVTETNININDFKQNNYMTPETYKELYLKGTIEHYDDIFGGGSRSASIGLYEMIDMKEVHDEEH
uniref:right-handed parallel beta-helix repeat-containing protein n=1 Tax=Vallitalea okinawensis TaxID=2078660 RepID=UPI000CFD4C2B|nr:right-handed parallel beta-helix repeat-containing protein [Vallitalea okinawensis]